MIRLICDLAECSGELYNADWAKFSLHILQQSTAPPQTFSMPITVQASNQSTLQFSNPGNALVTTSYVTSSSLTDTHLLSPQQPALQRNTVSPGLPQRPASAGEKAILEVIRVNNLQKHTVEPLESLSWGLVRNICFEEMRTNDFIVATD